MSQRKYSYGELNEAVLKSTSLSGVIKYLKLNKSSGTYIKLKKELDRLNIDPKFIKRSRNTKPYKSEEIFCENSTYDRTTLRNKIIKENILEYKCQSCCIENWNNKKISLQLDHINGIRNDNRIENLRFLCPNCHSQTETWGNKKKILT